MFKIKRWGELFAAGGNSSTLRCNPAPSQSRNTFRQTSLPAIPAHTVSSCMHGCFHPAVHRGSADGASHLVRPPLRLSGALTVAPPRALDFVTYHCTVLASSRGAPVRQAASCPGRGGAGAGPLICSPCSPGQVTWVWAGRQEAWEAREAAPCLP